MKNRIMRMCAAHKGVKDLPILPQGLPAVRRAGLPAGLWRPGVLDPKFTHQSTLCETKCSTHT